MQPKPASSRFTDDAFDTGFDADDDFAHLRDAAPAARPAAARTVVSQSRAAAALARELAAADPFADYPASRAQEDVADYEAYEPEPRAARHAAAHEEHDDAIPGADPSLGDSSVPRITIHAFFTRPETGDIIDKASRDRRMSKASTVVHDGGLHRAVEMYQNQPTPSLVLVECLDSANVLIADLERLAEVCDPGTKVVVIGRANDIALYRELMRRGVSEYLTPPLSVVSTIRAIAGLYADPASPFVGRQIAVVGARGGSGSSTIAHNLAWAISEKMHAQTVIADFDLAFGTAGLNFNQDPLQGVADALSQPDRLDPILMDRMMVRCTDRLSLFAAPATLDHDLEIHADAYEEVAQKVRGTAPFVVLDLPHAWSTWKKKMLIAADDLIIVATPDLASLRNAKNMVDLVRSHRPNDAPPRLVINQVGLPGRPEIPVKDFGDALGLTPSLVLPFDAKLFGQAANNGQMLGEVTSKSKVAEGIDHLAQLITRREPPVVQKASLISSLFRKK
jgi:pilus assembly protein CpaE